jgi:hypothetical protein
MGDNKTARDAVNVLRRANGKPPLDDLAEEVNRTTKGSRKPPRVNPLREFDELGPNWQGRTGTGRNVDQFRRDLNISRAAEEADKEDRELAFRKGGRVPDFAKGGKVLGRAKHSWPK